MDPHPHSTIHILGCKENYWRNSNNFCNPCPGDSTSGDDSGHCDCTAGFVWNTNDSDCTSCPGGTFSKSGATQCTTCLADTYSLGNATSCSNCPAHSTSPSGSDICDCKSGDFWNQLVSSVFFSENTNAFKISSMFEIYCSVLQRNLFWQYEH